MNSTHNEEEQPGRTNLIQVAERATRHLLRHVRRTPIESLYGAWQPAQP